MKGYGTEQICELLETIFPEHKIQRMDHDTTRKKNAYEEIIQDFQALKIDILVGTQMIAKGFDFENVSLVGIVDSDSMLNFPDFRSHERAFQLMSQVAGRAGRKKQARVCLFTNFKS
jgi:primosomal protein N' (replication factor Y)